VSNSIADLGADDFLNAEQQLLPPGAALTRDPDSFLTALLSGVSGRMVDVHAAVSDLTETESDPRYTVSLLPWWEKSFGLPDPCLGPNPSLTERHQQLIARISGRGGRTQGPAYLVTYALNLGFVVTITTFKPFKFGMKFGSQFLPPQARYVWQVNVPSVTLRRFQFGQNVFGNAFSSASNGVLVCELNRIKPAHRLLLFVYL
jgi:uncharacterized protein YmfQ (DUF2313 family)